MTFASLMHISLYDRIWYCMHLGTVFISIQHVKQHDMHNDTYSTLRVINVVGLIGKFCRFLVLYPTKDYMGVPTPAMLRLPLDVDIHPVGVYAAAQGAAADGGGGTNGGGQEDSGQG